MNTTGRNVRVRMRRLSAVVCLLAAAWPVVAQAQDEPQDPLYQRMADNLVRLMVAGWEAARAPAAPQRDTVAGPPPALDVPQRTDAAAASPTGRAGNAPAANGKPLPELASTFIPPSPPPTLPAPAAPPVATAPKTKPVAAATASVSVAPGVSTQAKASNKVKPPIDREAVLAEHGDEVTAEAATPSSKPAKEIGRGLVSWYGPGLHGRKTASGEPFDMNALTAAHRTLPFGTKVRVRNMATGQEVVVRVNDRGPHTKGRIIDLSRKAAESLGVTKGDHMVMLLSG